MPVVSSLDHLPTDGEFYSNNCVDGHCIGCGECCTDLLPTTRREIVRLRDYAKKHQLKEHRLPAGAALESVDLTCPFRNETTKRCEVYPVRPLICRAFICSGRCKQPGKRGISSKVTATSTPCGGRYSRTRKASLLYRRHRGLQRKNDIHTERHKTPLDS